MFGSSLKSIPVSRFCFNVRINSIDALPSTQIGAAIIFACYGIPESIYKLTEIIPVSRSLLQILAFVRAVNLFPIPIPARPYRARQIRCAYARAHRNPNSIEGKDSRVRFIGRVLSTDRGDTSGRRQRDLGTYPAGYPSRQYLEIRANRVARV